MGRAPVYMPSNVACRLVCVQLVHETARSGQLSFVSLHSQGVGCCRERAESTSLVLQALDRPYGDEGNLGSTQLQDLTYIRVACAGGSGALKMRALEGRAYSLVVELSCFRHVHHGKDEALQS